MLVSLAVQTIDAQLAAWRCAYDNPAMPGGRFVVDVAMDTLPVHAGVDADAAALDTLNSTAIPLIPTPA